MLGDEDLGSSWKTTARRILWTLTSLLNLVVGLAMAAGALLADGGELGPYLIGAGCGVLLALVAVAGQLMKGVRIGSRIHRRVRRMDGAGIEIRLRRGPGVCGELMLVCFVLMLCHGAGLGFRGGHVVLGVLLTLPAAFFAVVIADHLLTMRLRRAVLITPERLIVEIGSQVVSVGWKEIHVGVFEQISRSRGVTVRNRFIEVTPLQGAPSWAVTRRHQVRLLPRRWRGKVIRIGFWLVDHPERVIAMMISMRRQRDERARQVVLANESTMAYLTGDLEVSPLPSGR
ncbi:hypothetical protein FB381_1556 [Nocardioides albertanoniae]|uniref:Uncharacterized protein n=1 Tax=Nocardioides albertanoniae TaxID=1175486 RepID=A0A543A537_9ACTN|nr:hypothetical protein [Nocardioides albertanoniae]TQL67674.1 hypothetical protein FB381_1556 [Nocardioides albertanoniae]